MTSSHVLRNGRLPWPALLAIGLTLFALFFGAGNLIFPAALGQQAGDRWWLAVAGFLLTGVGLPLAGVMAMGYSGSRDLEQLAGRVHPLFGRVFTIALYLTIGPFFAAPRTATVAYEMGPATLLPAAWQGLGLVAFAALFFAVTLWLALVPGKLIGVIGRGLTPLLLLAMAVLIGATLAAPMGLPGAAQGDYARFPLAQGFLNGYDTMDALASLVFGILVVQAVRAHGAETPPQLVRATLHSSLIAVGCLALVYVFIARLGALSVDALGLQPNGAPVLSGVARHYFGGWGAALLGLIVLLACLTTAIGLIAACAAYFHRLLPALSHGRWALVFALLSFGVACFGLTTLIAAAVPVLVFLYPLTVVLIGLTFLHPRFGGRPAVYRMGLLAAGLVGAAYGLKAAGWLPAAVDGALAASLPWYASGMGWLLPALAGVVLGWAWVLARPAARAG